MLLMKKAFFEAIRRGEKTSTLRYWQYQHICSGSIQSVHGLGKLRIDDVRKINFSELSESDARNDGFDKLLELDIILDEIYTLEQRATRDLLFIQFTFIEEANKAWKDKPA